MAGDNKISPKEVYKELWNGRDFEISHLWQRSVFLTVFLLAIAGAYGSIILNMVFPDNKTITIIKPTNENEIKNNTYSIQNIALSVDAQDVTARQHFVAVGICWLGIVFSMLWIMMAKGSKLNFEMYEKGLNWFVENERYNSELLEPEIPHHGNLSAWTDKCDKNIFSTSAGYYSVSRINCTIGIVALILWSLLSTVHFGKFLIHKIENINDFQSALFGFIQLALFISISYFVLNFLCKSGVGKHE